MVDAEGWTRLITRVLASNPGPMTLDGTNSLVIRAPGNETAVVVDPGPDDAHIETLLALGPVDLILLTHHHIDHTESAARFSTLTGAPVRAADPALCIDGPPLADGELIVAGGTRIEIVATPGHTADSVSLFLPDDTALETERTGSMITGDTILGRGTTIIAQPDGSLADYLRSLDHLAAFGPVAVAPAHGPMLDDLAEVCRVYASHRRERLASIRAVLRGLDLEPKTDATTVTAVVDAVYSDIAPEVRFAAEASTRAQLEYLADHTGG
ncbi:MBL fold metallo-hydrolase [Microbacterium aoyamense]|uniref:MBL fold metallo-hydrolase n=1 Tax=Microbacterium aoyamense TaxID=344166 RepID=A0ABP5B093_9MICO|nr:MBL fold metallo-hydrolase [Microbacterium aoyamense]